MSRKKLDLYRQYRRQTRPKPKFSFLRGRAAPVFLLAVFCLSAWGVLLRQDLELMDQADQLRFSLEAPAAAKAQESREWGEKGRELLADLEAARTLTGRLEGYPRIDSTLLDRIARAGEDAVSVTVTGYDSATGVLEFNAASREVIDIPGYVMALERTGLFQTVSYTGYDFEDGGYVLRLNCALCSGTEGEGGGA